MDEFINLGQVEKRDPKAHPTDPRGVVREHSNGISLRAHFAGLAMQGILSKLGGLTEADSSFIDRISQNAVWQADSIIRELNKGNK